MRVRPLKATISTGGPSTIGDYGKRQPESGAEVFLAAADLPLAERAPLLASAWRTDVQLRGEVESLLTADSNDRVSLFTAIESEANSLLEGSVLLGARLAPTA